MASHEAELAPIFLEFTRKRLFDQYWPRMRECVAPLTVEQVWWRPNAASNSIGNLMLHLNGNVGQWLAGPFNRREDRRDRPAEFAAEGGLTAAELLAPYEIQGYHVSGLYAVYQVVEHFALHYGQIVYITKSITGRDLGFNKELDKTGRLGA